MTLQKYNLWLLKQFDLQSRRESMYVEKETKFQGSDTLL